MENLSLKIAYLRSVLHSLNNNLNYSFGRFRKKSLENDSRKNSL